MRIYLSVVSTLLLLGAAALPSTTGAHDEIQKNEEQQAMTQSNCVFCQIGSGERPGAIIARFKHCYAMKDAYPVAPGHVLIIPYEHTDNWFTASDAVQSDIVDALKAVKAILDEEYHPDGYNIGANCGPVAGQTVMHLHVHLIPRYRGDMEDPRGGVRGVIPDKQKY